MSTQWSRMLEDVRASVVEVAPQDAWERLRGETPVYLLDVREADERSQGAIEGAAWIPRGLLEMRAEAQLADKTRPVLVYCAGGTRSVLACATLRALGFSTPVSVAGGFSAWKQSGLPFFVPRDDVGSRYLRHLRLPEIGEDGQRRLLASRVLLVGAGGLGSPAAMYLAAAGVGRLGVVDADRVDVTNLQRQILHRTRNVGLPKVQSAREVLGDLNPDVTVDTHFTRLTRDNAAEIIGAYDVVVDGCDNFQTRYLVNDVCLKLGRPNMYASVFRFDGQASVFLPGEGPCYRCLYPEPPPAGVAPSCEEAGVLGVLPGLLGIIQATEAIKALLHIGRSLSGRLLCYDALDQSFTEFRLARNPACRACGPQADLDTLIATFEVEACPTSIASARA